MRHEKIIKDERGTVTIIIELWVCNNFGKDRNGNEYRYDISVLHKAPKKRNDVFNDTIATPEEILAAKLELWNKIKP